MANGKVLVYGGMGALGSVCINTFKSNKFWVGSIDIKANLEADANILVQRDASFKEQQVTILQQVQDALQGSKLDAIICVAGGWAGGNAKSKDFIDNTELVWKQSVQSSTIAAALAAHCLKEGGLLTLTGAKAALDGTPGMIGYGLAKAAVHQLTKSLATEGSGLPANASALAILPVTLDTPMNRKWMPDADTSTWTPLEFVGDLFLKWTQGERPANGSLLQLITEKSTTKIVFA